MHTSLKNGEQTDLNSHFLVPFERAKGTKTLWLQKRGPAAPSLERFAASKEFIFTLRELRKRDLAHHKRSCLLFLYLGKLLFGAPGLLKMALRKR